MEICKRVLYSGRVQGVGFRYAAQRLAQDFPIGGYVRNLPGGQVELAVEGPAEEVDRFLAQLAGQMRGYIDDMSEQRDDPSGLREFQIRF